jgi:hypothetical protein
MNAKVFRQWDDELCGVGLVDHFPQDPIHARQIVSQPSVHSIGNLGADGIGAIKGGGNQLADSCGNGAMPIRSVLPQPIPQLLPHVHVPIIPVHEGMYQRCPQFLRKPRAGAPIGSADTVPLPLMVNIRSP